MSRDIRNQALAIGMFAAALAASLLAVNCFFVVDFDKQMQMPDAVTVCNDDDDCQCSDPEDPLTCLPQDDCAYCELSSGDCMVHGADSDGDGWYVCTADVPGQRTPDCVDTGTVLGVAASSIHAGAPEAANLVDDDCDGTIDEGRVLAVGDPEDVPKGACASLTDCEWTNPVAVNDAPNIDVLWETNEGVSAKRLRLDEIQFPATPLSPSEDQYLTNSGATFNMTEPYLATNGTNLGTVWVDHLGGQKLYFAQLGIGEVPIAGPDWPSGGTYPGSWPSSPAEPIVVARPANPNFAVAFTGATAGQTDVYLALFNASTGALVLLGGNEFMNLSPDAGGAAASRPALVSAYNGFAAAWVEEGVGLRIAYIESGEGTLTSTTVPATIGGIALSAWRDPVLVRSDAASSDPTVFLLFAATPAPQTATEVFAVSLNLDQDFSTATPEAIFGPLLQVSASNNRLSADISASWDDNAIGIAWSDRETGSSIYFRRIADLGVGSGKLASDIVNLSASGTTPAEGQSPSVVALDSDEEYAVVWSGTGTGGAAEIFIRRVEAN